MRATYVEAPREELPDDGAPRVFLAGGITGCPDWQADLVGRLADEALTLLNPRRRSWPIRDPGASREQIAWEWRMLRKADVISFWFPAESVCPIALYELGAWAMHGVRRRWLVVGADPGYPRLVDIRVQLALSLPRLSIHGSLAEVAKGIREKAGEVRRGSA